MATKSKNLIEVPYNHPKLPIGRFIPNKRVFTLAELILGIILSLIIGFLAGFLPHWLIHFWL